MKTAILASQNQKKIKEIRAILVKFGMDVITRDDAGLPKDDIEETEVTFEENSLLKASTIMYMIKSDPELSEKYHDSPVIADDSGLVVDTLGGAPGVHSARYAGEDCDYAANNAKLLAELSGVPEGERTAHFVTVITMIYPDSENSTHESHITNDETAANKDSRQTDEESRRANKNSGETDEESRRANKVSSRGENKILVARGECHGRIAAELRGEGGFGYDPLFIPDGYDKSFAELGTDFKNTISHRAHALEELERMLDQQL